MVTGVVRVLWTGCGKFALVCDSDFIDWYDVLFQVGGASARYIVYKNALANEAHGSSGTCRLGVFNAFVLL